MTAPDDLSREHELIKKQHSVMRSMSAAIEAYRDFAQTVDAACHDVVAAIAEARGLLERGQASAAQQILASLSSEAPPPPLVLPEAAPVPPLPSWAVRAGAAE